MGPEPIEVDITFPDGRIFTVSAAQFLDGVIDMPTNVQFARFTNNAGQLSLNITIPGTWPYGCYRLTGRGLGVGGAHTASAFFVVIPGGRPGPTGNATLRATLNGQETNVLLQGQILEVDGRNFLGGELVSFWLTAPMARSLTSRPASRSCKQRLAEQYQPRSSLRGRIRWGATR